MNNARSPWFTLALVTAVVVYAGWAAWYCNLTGGIGMPPLPKLSLKASINPKPERFATDGNKLTRWSSGRDMVGNESVTVNLGDRSQFRGR